MSRHDLTLRCTIEIVDRPAAAEIGREAIRKFVAFQERRGTDFVTSDGSSPEVMSHSLAEDDRVIASWCLLWAAFTGFSKQAGITVGGLHVEHDDPAH